MSDRDHLDSYPLLADWFRACASSPPGIDEPARLLVWRTCESLCTGQSSAAKRWLDGFRVFLATTTQPLIDFVAAETLCQSCEAPLLDLLGRLGEMAMGTDQADHFLSLMQAGAEATGLVVLRFLAAWAALNSGRLEQCVSECEKVDEPYAAIFTIHGQALLELGQPREALEILDIAVKVSPSEILAWFQMAKARHVLGEHDAAFAALQHCRQLQPQSDEICLYMGLVALDAKLPVPYLGEALHAVKPLLGRFAGHPVVVFTLLQLACRLGDKQQAKHVVAGAAWPQMQAGAEVVRMLPPVLRALSDVGWPDIAAQMLGGITPAV